jgi:hypothetical protein
MHTTVHSDSWTASLLLVQVCMELIKPIDVPENEIFCQCVRGLGPSLITVAALYPCDRIMIRWESEARGTSVGWEEAHV